MSKHDKNGNELEDVNDETPDNFSEFGDGHKLKVREKYTDGEPPHEDDEDFADPDEPYDRSTKRRYP